MISVQKGFTLIEIAIVLLIVTILLGYTVAMFPVQQELKQYREVNSEMDEIVDALVAFAQVNGRLPCPDTTGDVNATGTNGVYDGIEDTDDLLINADGTVGADGLVDDCKAFFGFLPSATLGMNGDINDDNQLQDPWGFAYSYVVSDVDAGGAPGIDLISPNGIREEGIAAFDVAAGIPPDLFICNNSAVTGVDINCNQVTGDSVVDNVAAVIISFGKSNDLGASSNIQAENFDDFNDGTNDKVYVSTTRSDVAGSEFDDVIRWISPNLLFSKMIEADQLP